MKIIIQIAIAFISVACIFSCNALNFGSDNFFYKEEIRDSILTSSLRQVEGKFVYGKFDLLLLKASKVDYDKAIDSTLNTFSESSYKQTYLKMQHIVSNAFIKSDSVNLNSIKPTALSWSPMYNLAREGKLFVFDLKTKQIQDSIWLKRFYRERFNQDSIRVAFYEGSKYSTRSGTAFLGLVSKSSK